VAGTLPAPVAKARRGDSPICGTSAGCKVSDTTPASIFQQPANLRRLGAALALGLALGCAREHPVPAAGDARRGEEIFLRTQLISAQFGANALACTNCHLEGGKMPGVLALTGASRKYSKRSGLEDRVVRCFTHSLSARPPEASGDAVMALTAYIRSIGVPGASKEADESVIPAENLIPIGELNAERGRARYGDLCSGCHGLDGQGYRERREPLPYDYVPPVWGPRSYDDAAGLARVYMLAGFLRHGMPRDEPGTLDDRDAQEIAAFVNGLPRPSFPDKKAWDGNSPVDAVYDTERYPKNPFTVPLAIAP
jgi:thiosulfate dehydrogenase